jgi:hypothetical protein
MNLTCSCGTVLAIAREHRGGPVRCPRCGAVHHLHTGEPTEPPDEPPSRLPLYFLIGGLATALVLVALVLVIVLLNRRPAESGREPPPPDPFQLQLEKAKEDSAKAQARVIATAAENYALNNDGNIPTIDQLTLPDPNNNNKPYLPPDALLDPWKKKFILDPAGPHHSGAVPDVYTTSPSGKVLGNWKE